MKSTSFEKEKRIYEVASLIIGGITRRQDIIQYITTETDWGIKVSMIDKYMAEAKRLIKDTEYEDIELQFKKSLNQYDDLIYKNLKIQDYREVRNCIKDKAALLGLVTDKSEITHKGATIEVLIDDKS